MANQTCDESANKIRLINSDDEGSIRLQTGNQQKPVDRVQMKKQLGLLEGVAIILGIIFGSGMLKLNVVNKN